MDTKLLVIGQLPPPHHGSNVMTDVFCKTLRKIGFRVFICEKIFSKRIEEMGNFAISKILKIPIVACKIILNVIVNKPKICFYLASVNPPSLYFDLLLLLFINLFGCDVVLYLHGKGYERIYQGKGYLVRLIFYKIFSNCLGAIVLGRALKQDIDRYFPDERVFLLPNCIPDSDFRKTPQKKINDNKENGTKVIQVLYLSNLIPTKGAMEFLKMAKIVISHCQNVRFVLAGSTNRNNEFLKEINQYIEKNKLNKFVKRVGAIYGEEKEKIFQKSDIFVFPTYFALETFGLVNLEAMRAGLPVISSYEGSIPEIIIHGQNGYTEDPQNIEALSQRVIELIKNDKLRARMGSAGRKLYVENYTTDIYERNLNRAVNFFLDLKSRHE
jgi:glycosyltransferase involved in cell wall biosynthesis